MMEITISITDIIWLIDHKDELEEGSLAKQWIDLFIGYMCKATEEKEDDQENLHRQ